VVNAITTLLVAIAGLVSAVNGFGSGDEQAPSTTAVPAAGAAIEGDAQAELRSRIPTSVRSSCGPPVHPEEGAAAAFNCKYRELVGLQYNLFASTREMERDFARVKRRYGLQGTLGGSSCAAGDFEGDYVDGDRTVGRVLCFVNPGSEAAIVWTHGELDIVSFAWREDLNLEALYDAWRQGLGPDA
jgi:hypothetical protein